MQAYIAISLDATGALRYLAFSVAKKGGTSGWKLHFYLYLFFIVLGGVVGNVSIPLKSHKLHVVNKYLTGSGYLIWHGVSVLFY